jgi:hypothetical protein
VTTLRDAFRELGYPESLLPNAITAFGTADRARRWIEAVGDRALGRAFVYEKGMSKVEIDEYLRWRRVGLGVLDALRLPRRFAIAGLGISDYLRWREAGIGDGLERFVPDLLAGLSFDELLNILTEWNPGDGPTKVDAVSEFKEMLYSKPDMDELRHLLRSGLSGHQIYVWRKSGIPDSDWWAWIDLGFDADSAVEYSGAGLSPSTAQDWAAVGITGAGARIFVAKRVPLEVARHWTDAGLSPDDAVDLILRRVELNEALELVERGIRPWQVKRTKSGLKLDLYPWQKDPLDQLPEVIKRGRIRFTIWTTALGDRQGHEVTLKWDGGHTVEWYEDISPDTGALSPASSSPAWGVASWPDSRDVLLTYTWHDLGLRGYAKLEGAAPIGEGPHDATDPRQWLRFGQALIEFVLLDLGSGRHDPNELPDEYYLPAKDKVLELDDVFRVFLKELRTGQATQGFDEWLSGRLQSGVYTVDIPSQEAREASRAGRDRSQSQSARNRRTGLGPNQLRILELLKSATEDGLDTDRIANSLRITQRAAAEAAVRLRKRGLVVLTTYGSIVWLPERRLKWLQQKATTSAVTAAEITELSELVTQHKAD